jgi:glucokinase
MSDLYIGVDIGGTNLKLGLFDPDLNLLAKGNYPNPEDMSPGSLVEHVGQSVDRLFRDNGMDRGNLRGIGVGCPGTINSREGIIIAAPNLPFRHTPLRQMLRERLGCPCLLENDANTAAWGEFTAGAAKDVEHMVFFTLGTGIGGGIISEGMMIRGYTNQAAELGHIIIYPDSDRLCGCGQYGCAEAHASATQTARRAMEGLQTGARSSLQAVYKEKGKVTCRDVFDHAKAGDAFAMKIVDGTAKTLGLLCVNMLHTTQPQRILFAGGMIGAGDFLLEKIRFFFNKYVWTMQEESLDIRFASLGEDAGIYGAGALARETV